MPAEAAHWHDRGHGRGRGTGGVGQRRAPRGGAWYGHWRAETTCRRFMLVNLKAGLSWTDWPWRLGAHPSHGEVVFAPGSNRRRAARGRVTLTLGGKLAP